MTKKTRRHLSPARKAELLRLHLEEKRPVSEICEEHGLQPSLYYSWLRQLMANAELALAGRRGERSARHEENMLRARVEALEAKLAKKDTVIAEVTEELVKTKKENGLRQVKPGRGGWTDLGPTETSRWSPAGIQPRRGKVGPHPEASLAWRGRETSCEA